MSIVFLMGCLLDLGIMAGESNSSISVESFSGSSRFFPFSIVIFSALDTLSAGEIWKQQETITFH